MHSTPTHNQVTADFMHQEYMHVINEEQSPNEETTVNSLSNTHSKKKRGNRAARPKSALLQSSNKRRRQSPQNALRYASIEVPERQSLIPHQADLVPIKFTKGGDKQRNSPNKINRSQSTVYTSAPMFKTHRTLKKSYSNLLASHTKELAIYNLMINQKQLEKQAFKDYI